MSFFFSLFCRFFSYLSQNIYTCVALCLSVFQWVYVEVNWHLFDLCMCVQCPVWKYLSSGFIFILVLTMFWSAVFYFVGPLRFQTGSITRWDVYQIKVSNTFVVAVVVIRIDKPRVNFPNIDLVVHGYLLRRKVSLGRRGGNNNIGSRRVIWFSSNRSSFLLYNSQILWALLLGCPLIFIVSYSSFCRC